MNERRDLDIGGLRERLLARREELERLVAAHGEDSRPVEVDQTRIGRLARMDELQSQAMSIETERRRQEELSRIDAALGRMESGDYGYCVACGEEIAARRLELDPAAATCIECAGAAKG